MHCLVGCEWYVDYGYASSFCTVYFNVSSILDLSAHSVGTRSNVSSIIVTVMKRVWWMFSPVGQKVSRAFIGFVLDYFAEC